MLPPTRTKVGAVWLERRERALKRILFCACALALAAASQASVVIVHVFHFDFSINPMGGAIVDPVINVGDTIRWQFDMTPHSATSVAGIPEVWDSGFVAMGNTYDHTFTNVGVWQYYCQLHGFDNGNQTAGGMSGTVTVVVPEPSTMAALGLGFLMLLRRGRR